MNPTSPADGKEPIHSAEKAHLCAACRAKIPERPVPEGLVEDVDKEFKRIKRSLAYAALDFVKAYPIASFLISSTWALLIGIASNWLFKLLSGH